MQTRVLGLSVRAVILTGVRDLLHRTDPLARPHSDEEPIRRSITDSPFSFGELPPGAQSRGSTSTTSATTSTGEWILNSIFYSLVASGITLLVGIPAGYGLALGKFPGRKLILSLTLISMIIPAAALVLPIYLELNAVHRIFGIR